jgi:hypothetical protein
LIIKKQPIYNSIKLKKMIQTLPKSEKKKKKQEEGKKFPDGYL